MFLTQHVAQNRLPVALLTGFLGSGKTTLVNVLLSDERLAGTAVAINEFGDVPLDQHLIPQDGDQTVVLANGCLCCRVAGDFEDAVMRIYARREAGALPRFSRMIIEPSGLADPAPIAQAILRNPVMAGALRLETIIATADALLVEGQLSRHPETRKQIGLADRIVLTKTDMADPASIARVERVLRQHNPHAPIHTAVQGAVDPASLLPEAFLSPGLVPSRGRTALFADSETADHGQPTTAVSILADRPLRWRPFDAWLRALRIGHAAKLLRIKGLLNVAGSPGPVVIQGVEHVMHAPVALDEWPDDDHRSRLVLITQGLPAGLIRESWDRALPGLLAVAAH
jgi:G3E family GTPase